MEEEIEQEIQEKVGWNIGDTKLRIISEMMTEGERSLIIDDNPVRRLKCWRSISILIDNRLNTRQRAVLRKLERDIKSKGYIKNRYVDKQWVRGCAQWYENQFILKTKPYLFYSNRYVKYINKLLKDLGMDIPSKVE